MLCKDYTPGEVFCLSRIRNNRLQAYFFVHVEDDMFCVQKSSKHLFDAALPVSTAIAKKKWIDLRTLGFIPTSPVTGTQYKVVIPEQSSQQRKNRF